MERELRSSYYSRGQIWWLEKDVNEYNGHTMDAKDRYYLVVSNELNNINAPIANVLVISSRPYDRLPTHIPFKMMSGKDSIIECEQIYTKSIEKFKRGRYIGTVSSYVMDQVSRALAAQLQLTSILSESVPIRRPRPVTSVYRKEDDNVPTIKRDPVVSKETECKIEVVSKEMNETSEIKEVTPMKTAEHKSQVDKFNERLKKTEAIQKELPELKDDPIKESKPIEKDMNNSNLKKGRRWTEEMKIQFLVDCDKMSPREIMTKYGFSSVNGVYTKKYTLLNNRK